MKIRVLKVLLAALCLLSACKGPNSFKEQDQEVSTVVDSIANDPKAQKLVVTAEMSMKVKNASKVAEKIADLTTAYHGNVTNHYLRSEEVGSKEMAFSSDSLQRVTILHTTADMTLQVPSDSLDRLMTNISKMGIYVSSRRMDIENRTLDLLASELKLNNRIEIADQQRSYRPKNQVPEEANKALALRDKIVDDHINNQRIEMAARMSTLKLSLDQSQSVIVERIANGDPGAYELPLFKRLAFALTNGWSIFMSFMIGLANLWVFIVIGAALWWAVHKHYRRKPAVPAANI